MKISYDSKSDAFAFIFQEGRVSKDVEISPNVFAGYDRAGKLLEIQILEVSKAESPWMTLEAASKYLDISQRTLLRWIKSGKIKPTNVAREYRITPKELKKLAG